jgi:hypothetical protein
MTATADESGPARGNLKRLAVFLGHHSLQWEPWIFTTMIAFVLFRWWVPTPPLVIFYIGSVIGTVTWFSLLGLLVVQRVHDRNLCERDLDHMPWADPQGAVDREMRQLKFHHNMRARWIMVIMAVAPLILINVAGNWPMPARVILTVLAALAVACMIYTCKALLVHRWLRRWCPMCHHRHGDDDESTPAPTPDPAGVGQR